LDLASLDKRITATTELWRASTQYQAKLAELHKLKADKDNLGAPGVTEEKIQELKQLAEVYRKSRSELLANTSLYDRLLKAISGATAVVECPLCGSHIDDFNSLRQKLVQKLDQLNSTLKAEESKFNQTFAAAEDGSKALTAYSIKVKMLDNQITQIDAALKEMPATTVKPGQILAELTGMQEVRQQLEQLFRQKSSLEAQVDINNRYHKDYLVEYSAALAVVREIPECQNQALESALQSVQNTVRQIDLTLTQAQERKVKIASLASRTSVLTDSMTTAQRNLAELERKRGQQSTYADAKATLERTRDWFHYANGPHSLAVSVLEDLTSIVNSFLQRLNAPFVAFASTTDLGYRCSFVDGRLMPKDSLPDADELSGGQKALLAISFRLASYCMFANKQGVLVLDEPLAYLDADNVNNFCGLLGKLKEVTKSLDLQLFVSTHEKQTLPFFDSVIDLNEGK